jgi:hypothetical protein
MSYLFALYIMMKCDFCDTFILCMHGIGYLSLTDIKQRVRYCLSCPIIFDLLNALICMHRSDYGLWYDLECLTNLLSISCSSVIDCYTFTLCMHRSEYLSLSDSLQRICRCSSGMRELD